MLIISILKLLMWLPNYKSYGVKFIYLYVCEWLYECSLDQNLK